MHVDKREIIFLCLSHAQHWESSLNACRTHERQVPPIADKDNDNVVAEPILSITSRDVV
jgi:hypothetical protein